jgi:hypothetical protein
VASDRRPVAGGIVVGSLVVGGIVVGSLVAGGIVVGSLVATADGKLRRTVISERSGTRGVA